MKKIIFFIFFSYQVNSFGQKEQFESSSAIEEKSDFKIEHISRLIVFTDQTITISNWLNGSKEALKLEIDTVVEKERSLEGMCKWYYCTSLQKDPINGFSKTIVILPEGKDKIDVFTFADEVNVYHTQILIDKE